MSDANRVGLAYVVESTFGDTPSGPPTLQDLRFVSESLAQITGTVSSNEIRSDRQVTDLIRTGLSAGGDINFELSYGAYDEFLEAALLSAVWTADVNFTPATTVDAASGDNSFNDSASGFSFTANEWIFVSGFVDPANNGWFKLTSATTAKLVVTGGTLVTEAVGPTIDIDQAEKIKAGTTFRSFVIERVYADLSSEFSVFNGMAIDTFSLAIASDQIITGSFGFIGKAAVSPSPSATAGTGSNTAAGTNSVMNGIDDVSVVLEGQSSYPITAFSMSLNNNLRARLQVATLGAISIGVGTIDLTGSIQAYFDSPAVMDKYLANTASSLAIGFLDSAGNRYVIDMPQVKFTSGQRVAGGINTDVIADLNFTAYRHAASDTTLSIHRLATGV